MDSVDLIGLKVLTLHLGSISALEPKQNIEHPKWTVFDWIYHWSTPTIITIDSLWFYVCVFVCMWVFRDFVVFFPLTRFAFFAVFVCLISFSLACSFLSSLTMPQFLATSSFCRTKLNCIRFDDLVRRSIAYNTCTYMWVESGCSWRTSGA